MNRIAGRLWVKVFVKAHIRAVWNKLNNMTDYDDPSSAFESLIRLTSTDSSYCDLLGVMVDTISPESPMASWFLYHIIDLAALPSQQTIRRLSQELLSKCSPGGLARLRTRKRCRPTAALVWGVLASRLAGELSTVLFSEEVCDCLLNNIEYDADMLCKVFSIIALEKFALTGPCKIRIMQRPIQTILRGVASMSTFGLTNQDEIAGIRQAKLCADWALRKVFYDIPTQTRRSYSTGPRSPTQDHFGSNSSSSTSPNAARGSMSSSGSMSMGSEKSLAPKNSHIKVMLNITEGPRHWKISEDGLMVRNDGSSFESIRATVSVTCGKWYYEVTVLTSGIMQIGWATPQCRFCPDEGTGVGDDLFGFSYDGCRNLLWANGESTHYGDSGSWRPGDVLGFYLDVDNSQLECFLNGVPLGSTTPFASIGHFQDQAAAGYFPAFSVTPLQQIELNFGASPFRYAPARPWRNLNDHGTLTPELREAITKSGASDLASKLNLDPETGLRVAIVTEQEIDYSPMCRTRIFQRQMIPTPSGSTEASVPGSCSSGGDGSGLCISGVSGSFSAPQLNAQGDIVCSEASLPILADRPLTAAEAAAHRLSRQQSMMATSSSATSMPMSSSSSSSAAAMGDNANVSSTVHAEEQDREEKEKVKEKELTDTNRSVDDIFSPPCTTYFRFLNAPTTSAATAGSRHPMTSNHQLATTHSSTYSSDSGESLTLATSTSMPTLLSPMPSSSSASQVPAHAMKDDGEEGNSDSRASDVAIMEEEGYHDEEEEDALMDPAEDASPRSISSLDSFGSGREASLDEVMERGVPDFPDASTLSSHRNSISTSMASLSSVAGLVGGGVVSGGVVVSSSSSSSSSSSNSIGGHGSGDSSSGSNSNSSIISMGSGGGSGNIAAPLPLQDALPLPSPAQRPLPPLMPSQHALRAQSSSSSSSSSSTASTASAPLSFPPGHHHPHHHPFHHHHHHQHQHQHHQHHSHHHHHHMYQHHHHNPFQHHQSQHPLVACEPASSVAVGSSSSTSSSSVGRRSSLADDMRLLLQQQGILPAQQAPQSPMIGTAAIMQQPHGSRGNVRVGPMEQPASSSLSSSLSSSSFADTGSQQRLPTSGVVLEQQVGYMRLAEVGLLSSSSSSPPDSLSPLPTLASLTTAFGNNNMSSGGAGGSGAGGASRPGGRRASLPANRLEM
ncbi:hypothetical protein DFQ26_007339 [Actinomortierella ambigua]|nr:hypothetical protein DFQ26_007339 [Actinomortierella ambigua]